MGGFFNINSPFFRVMSKVFDVCVLSIIWVVCCIPVITIGPATTALYYSIVKCIRRNRGYATKEFFHAFKVNFKLGAITGVFLTVLTFILMVNVNYAKMLGTSFGNFLWYVYIAMLIVVLVLNIYVYPVLSRFTVTFKNLLKISLFFAIRHFLTTVVSVLILGASIFLVEFTLLVGLVFVPAVCALLQSFMMENVLKRYIPDAQQNEDDGPKDEWYNE